MTDQVTNVEIEDVLSSIRRLVSTDTSQRDGDLTRSLPSESRPEPKLVLTPSQRVDESLREVAQEAEVEETSAEEKSVPPEPRPLEIAHTVPVDAIHNAETDAAPAEDIPEFLIRPADPVVKDDDNIIQDHAKVDSVEEADVAAFDEQDLAVEEMAEHEPPGELESLEAPEPIELELTEATENNAENQPDIGDATIEEIAEVEVSERLASIESLVADQVAQTSEDVVEDVINETAEVDPDADRLTTPAETFEDAVARQHDEWEPDGENDVGLEPNPVEPLPWQDTEVESASVAQEEAQVLEQVALDEPIIAVAVEEEAQADHSPGSKTELDSVAETEAAPEAEPASSDAKEAREWFDDESVLDEDALRDLVTELVREELQGAMGEKITRNVRRLVRREIRRALAAQGIE